MTKGGFLRTILKIMDEKGKKMNDTFITFPNGDTITFSEFWIQVNDETGYGGRCFKIYEEMFNETNA